MTGRTLLGSMLVGLLAWLAIFACSLSAIWGYHQAFGAEKCHTVETCHVALAWQKKHGRDLDRKLAVASRHGMTLGYIARIGAAISGHPPSEFTTVGRCESTNNVTSQEYGFGGATGWLQYQWRTWTGTAVYRWFRGTTDYRKDPLVETVAAAIFLAHGGHWSGPWAASESCHHLP